MRLQHDGSWRCHGRIINYETRVYCCNGSRTSERIGSFFFNRSLEVNKVMLILYEWLHRTARGQIAKKVGCSAKVVRSVLNGLQELLQEDLSLENDLRIGKISYFIKFTHILIITLI